MTTYERAVDSLLPFNLMPLVVPELKTITLGGAITGLGIESSSWRNGMPHESLIEMDVLTGAGQVVTARPDNDHRDLFYGFPNSYGTLGYALRVQIELEYVMPYIHLRHLRFGDFGTLISAIGQICESSEYQEERVDFVDGIVFSPAECYLTLGAWTGSAPYTSDYTKKGVYYRSVQSNREDWLTARDYLWRWDTDWFWCSRAFGVQRKWVRRTVPRRFLRSDVYWKIVAFEERYHLKARTDRLLGHPAHENVIQDVELPISRLADLAMPAAGTRPLGYMGSLPPRPGRPLCQRRVLDERPVEGGYGPDAPQPMGGGGGGPAGRTEVPLLHGVL
jgi:FAD/FMN-containing dehydrogenase